MKAERDFGDAGHIVIRVTPAEASLISEGLYAVEDADRRLAGKQEADIDECDREDLRAESAHLVEMRAAIDAALSDRGLSDVIGGERD